MVSFAVFVYCRFRGFSFIYFMGLASCCCLTLFACCVWYCLFLKFFHFGCGLFVHQMYFCFKLMKFRFSSIKEIDGIMYNFNLVPSQSLQDPNTCRIQLFKKISWSRLLWHSHTGANINFTEASLAQVVLFISLSIWLFF